MNRRLLLALVACTFTLFGCNNGPKRDLKEDSSMDHVSQGPKLAAMRVAHGISKLEKFEKFAFDVPPHALTPRLQGEFKSFQQGAGGARIADESADVELMVMTDEQYDAFTHKRSAESLYAIEPSHDHGVSIALPTTRSDVAHYFVVFTRSADGKNPIWVNADLTVNFDSSL
jgi:hypothetical protein